MMIADGGGWTHRVAPVTSAPPPPANTVVVQLASGPKQVTILPGATAQRPLATFIGPLTAEMEVLRSGPPRPTNLQQVAANAPQFNPLPGAPPNRPLQGFNGPLSPEMEVLRSGPPARPLEDFIGPLSPAQEVLRSGPPAILPRNLTEGGAPTAHPTAGLASDDPRLELIDQGYQLQQIDQQAKALAGQPIDIEAAKAQVLAAQAAEGQFWSGVFGGLKSREQAHLASLAQAIDAAPEQGKLAALQKFESALASALTPDQQTQLRKVQRGTEDAQLNLEGQLLGKELRTARLDGGFCGNEAQKAAAAGRLELVMVDARVHVTQVRETAANRKLQDAQLLLMTPQNQQTLAPQQQKLADAVRQVQLNPQDADAQQRLTIAQTLFDGAMTMTINSADKRTLDVLQAAVQRERTLGQQLTDEAATVHQYDAMSRESQRRCGALNPTEQRIFDLAKADYQIVQKDAQIRGVALEAASAAPERRDELLQQLDGLLVDRARQQSSTDLSRSQFNRDVAVHNQHVDVAATFLARSGPSTPQNGVTPVGLRLPTSTQAARPVTGQPLQVAAPFAVGLPSLDLTVDAANRQVDAATRQRDELEKLLKPPPPPKPSGWDHALSIGMGVLQVVGGVLIAAAASWTGVGAVAGALIAADGLARLGHAVADAKNGTSTDTWQSQGLQKLGMDRGAANRTDAGISLVTTFAAPTSGVARLGLLGFKTAATTIKSTAASYKAASLGYKVAAGYGGASVVDMTQAQFRYAVFNHDPTPFTVRGLMAMGVSPTAANYLTFGGLLVAQGGMTVRGPGAVPSNASPAQAVQAGQVAQVAPVARATTTPRATAATQATASGVTLDIASTRAADGGNLVIVGAGNGGATFLADALVGQRYDDVKLVFRDKPGEDLIARMSGPMVFKQLLDGGDMHAVNFEPQHFAHLFKDSGRVALANANTIVVTVPDIPSARLPLFEHLADVVQPGQTIALAGAGAQPALAKIVDADPRWNGTNWVLFENLPYGTRVDSWEPGLITGKRKLTAQAAFWGDQQEALARLKQLFPLGDRLQEPKPTWPNFEFQSYLSMAFQLGYGAHTLVAYHPMNLQITRQGDRYFHWWDGAMRHDPKLAERIAVLDEERVRLTEAYGLEGENNYARLNRSYNIGVWPPESQYTLFQATEPFYRSKSEESLHQLVTGRYTTENFPNGLRSLWLAERAGIELPETARVMAELDPVIRSVGAEVGVADVFERYGLYAYQQILTDFRGGVPEVTRLINSPNLG